MIVICVVADQQSLCASSRTVITEEGGLAARHHPSSDLLGWHFNRAKPPLTQLTVHLPKIRSDS